MTNRYPEIVRGRVRCQGLAAADLELTVGDGQPQKFSARNRFELILDDNSCLTVEAKGTKLLGRRVELRGTFGEFANHPLLAPFGVKAGPHIGIRISGAAVQDGDEAAAHGRRAPLPDAPDGRELLQAELMASGPEAADLVSAELGKIERARDRKAREKAGIGPVRKNLWVLYLLPALALFPVYLGGFDGLRKLAMALLLTGAVSAARRRTVPMFHALVHSDKEAETPDATAERWPTWDFILGSYIFIVFIGVTLAAVEAAARLKTQFSPFLALIPAAAIMWNFRNHQGQNIRRMRALLNAPALPDQAADGAYGSVEGMLTCAVPPGGPGPVSCTWCAIPTYDADTGKGGGSIAQRSRVGNEMTIETGKEAIGLRHGQGTLWASALKIERRTCGWTQLTNPGTGSSKVDTEDYIPDGSRVLAAGRIADLGGQRTFSAEGTETTLLFASGRWNPRMAIRLTIAAYVLSGVLLLLAAAGPGVLGLVSRAKTKTPEKATKAIESPNIGLMYGNHKGALE